MVWAGNQLSGTELHWWYINIGSGNGKEPTGNKALMIQIRVAIWHHQATFS